MVNELRNRLFNILLLLQIMNCGSTLLNKCMDASTSSISRRGWNERLCRNDCVVLCVRVFFPGWRWTFIWYTPSWTLESKGIFWKDSKTWDLNFSLRLVLGHVTGNKPNMLLSKQIKNLSNKFEDLLVQSDLRSHAFWGKQTLCSANYALVCKFPFDLSQLNRLPPYFTTVHFC